MACRHARLPFLLALLLGMAGISPAPSLAQAVYVPSQTRDIKHSDGQSLASYIDGVPSALRLSQLRSLYARIGSIRGGNVDQLTVLECGDSYADLRTRYLVGNTNTGTPAPLLANMLGITQGIDGWLGSITLTGGAALTAAGTNHAYWGNGIYWTLPASSQIKIGTSGAAFAGNEFAVYPISDSGGGTLDVSLYASDYSTLLASVTGYSTSGSLGASKVGFFIVDVTLTGLANGDTYTLTYAGQTTATITYSSTPATNVTNITNAFGALTVGASLSGKVAVSNTTGSTYRIIVTCAGNGTVPARPSVSYAALTGTGTATFATVPCWVRVTGNTGTCALVPACLGVNRVQSRTIQAMFSYAGTQMSAVIGINQGIANVVFGDLAPDAVTIDQAAGQMDSQATLSAYETMLRTALPSASIIHIGFGVTGSTSDSITANRAAIGKVVAAANNVFYFDPLLIFPTYTSVSALGGGIFWTGDGTHLGVGYNALIADAMIKEAGLMWLVNGLTAQDVRTGNATLTTSLSLGAQTTPNLQIAPNANGLDTDAIVSQYLTFKGPDGTPIAKVSADGNGLNFYATRFVPLGYANLGLTAAGANTLGIGDAGGNYSPYTLLMGTARIWGKIWLQDANDVNDVYILSGSGSPEGVVTAPKGSEYHRTDGGTGTCLYIHEGGSGNTGWVAK